MIKEHGGEGIGALCVDGENVFLCAVFLSLYLSIYLSIYHLPNCLIAMHRISPSKRHQIRKRNGSVILPTKLKRSFHFDNGRLSKNIMTACILPYLFIHSFIHSFTDPNTHHPS